MKTTLDIDEMLLREAKQRAGAAGTTLKAFVEEALRIHLLGLEEPNEDFILELPVVVGDRPPAVDISDRRELYDYMERERGH